jgi:hypothetical protein
MPEFLTDPDELDIRQAMIEVPPKTAERQFVVDREVTNDDYLAMRDRAAAFLKAQRTDAFMTQMFWLDALPNPLRESRPMIITPGQWQQLENDFIRDLDINRNRGNIHDSLVTLQEIKALYPEQLTRFAQHVTPSDIRRHQIAIEARQQSGLSNDDRYRIYDLMLYDPNLITIDRNKAECDKMLDLINAENRAYIHDIEEGFESSFAYDCLVAKVLYPDWFPSDFISDSNWGQMIAELRNWRSSIGSSDDFIHIAYTLHLLSADRLEVRDHRVVPIFVSQTDDKQPSLPEARRF